MGEFHMGMKKNDKFNLLATEINNRVIKNINALLEYRKISKAKLTKLLEQDKASYSRPYITMLLQENFSTHISFAYIVLFCDYFGITLENLASENFDASEYKSSESPTHQEYLNIVKTLELSNEKTFESSVNVEQTPTYSLQNNIFFNEHWLSDSHSLVYDPNNLLFTGYLQDYYCYYFPTISSENNTQTLIIRGVLSLQKVGNMCKATLRINTSGAPNTYSDFDKEYVGYAVISVVVRNLQCIMYSEKLGEFCFLSFRHFKLNKDNLYCRIAEVLSSSSGSEARTPIVQRMFISSEKIKEDDLQLISSSLLLNHSSIAISEKALAKLSAKNEVYAQISRLLLADKEKEHFILLDEKSDVLPCSKKILNQKSDRLEYLSSLRSLSYAFRYNKVTELADKNITDLLQSKGYYTQKDRTDK